MTFLGLRLPTSLAGETAISRAKPICEESGLVAVATTFPCKAYIIRRGTPHIAIVCKSDIVLLHRSHANLELCGKLAGQTPRLGTTLLVPRLTDEVVGV